jgi:hypothetical protein
MNTVPKSHKKQNRLINPYKLFVGSFIPNWLLKREEISQGAKLCYARLCQYAGEDGECYPSQKKLAEALGIPESPFKGKVKSHA